MKARSLKSAVEGLSRGLSDTYSTSRRRVAEAEQEVLQAETELFAVCQTFAGAQMAETEVIGICEVRQVLTDRERRLREQTDKLPMVEASIARLEQELSLLGERIDEADREAARLRSQEGAIIEAEARHREASQEEERLRAELREIAAEVDAKLVAYSDAVFTYLASRGYGTAQYTGKGLMRRLDGWLAERSHFAVNRANHQVLQRLIEMATERHAEARERVTALDRALAAVLDEVEVRVGLRALRDEYAVNERRSQQYKAEAREIKSFIADHAACEDAGWKRAHGLLAEMLVDKTFDELLSLASATKTSQDDEMASRIVAARENVEQARKRVAKLKEAQREAERSYQRAKKLENEFEYGGYGNSRYSYGGLDTDSLLTGYMLGRADSSDVLSTMRSHRSEEESWSSRSSPSVSRPSESIFSTSDSVGGGGYSTSDSF